LPVLLTRLVELDAGKYDPHEGPIAPKSKAGLRALPILGVLRDHLVERVVGTGTDLVFGRTPAAPFDPKTINGRAKRAWARANEQECEAAEGEGRDPVLLRPITLHECRHTFASLLIDAGVNPKAIQEFMGHATIEETFSRYGHLMPGARDHARALVDAYFEAQTAGTLPAYLANRLALDPEVATFRPWGSTDGGAPIAYLRAASAARFARSGAS
jgi:hypothetical protein